MLVLPRQTFSPNGQSSGSGTRLAAAHPIKTQARGRSPIQQNTKSSPIPRFSPKVSPPRPFSPSILSQSIILPRRPVPDGTTHLLLQFSNQYSQNHRSHIETQQPFDFYLRGPFEIAFLPPAGFDHVLIAKRESFTKITLQKEVYNMSSTTV